MIDFFLNIHVIGKLTIYKLLTLASFILFLITSWECIDAYRKQQKEIFSEAVQARMCVRWRYERNFWLSLLCLVSWLVLNRFQRLIKELLVATVNTAGGSETNSETVCSEKKSTDKKAD